MGDEPQQQTVIVDAIDESGLACLSDCEAQFASKAPPERLKTLAARVWRFPTTVSPYKDS